MFSLSLCFLLFLCLFYVGQAIYNIFLHPLRSYPGPWYAKATKLPWLYQRVHGTQMYWIARLHEQYGAVVQVAPDHLSYIDPEAWRDIYGHKTSSGRGNLPKDLRYYGPAPTGGASILNADDETHARLRRSISHAFSEKALTKQATLLHQYVNLFVARLRETSTEMNGPIDMVRMYNFITFDFTADLTFGEPLGLLESCDYIPWVASIATNFKTIGIIWSIQSAVPFLMPILTRTVLRGMVESRKRHARFSQERVDQRLKRKTDRPDVWTYVLRNCEAGKGLSRSEMHANATAIMGAGTETTATLLSGITWLLCTHRDKLRLLNQEIRQAFNTADNNEITMQSLARLPYLNACLQEALRLYPPGPLGLPRVAPPGGAVICGKPVTAKTTVYVSPYAAYRSKRNFHDPEGFNPERWLLNPAPCFTNDKLNVVEPFSLGPRNCVGKSLAWHEMRSIIASLILNFDIHFAAQADKNWANQKAYFMWEKKPLYVTLYPRER